MGLPDTESYSSLQDGPGYWIGSIDTPAEIARSYAVLIYDGTRLAGVWFNDESMARRYDGERGAR